MFPKKYLGQHFLQSDFFLKKIASITPITNEHIVEIGPGYGNLTQYILEKNPASFIAIEYDRFLLEKLQEKFSPILPQNNIQFICQNVLHMHPYLQTYKIISNIPYYLTSPILFHFSYSKFPPTEMVLLVQKEVALRLVSYKGKHSFLSHAIRKKYNISYMFSIKKHFFSPMPKVDSAVIHCVRDETYKHIEDRGFLTFLKHAFRFPRKKLLSNLQDIYEKQKIIQFFENYHMSELIRPESLSLETYIQLYQHIHSQD